MAGSGLTTLLYQARCNEPNTFRVPACLPCHRLWTDYPIYTMQGTPLISLSQGMLLVATLRSGITRPTPSCCIHAWQLPRSLMLPRKHAAQQLTDSAAGGGAAAAGGGGEVCKLSVSPNKKSSMGLAAAAAAAGVSGGSSGSGSSRGPEAFGEGAMALGRATVAVAGGAGQVGVSSSNTVMLAVSDQQRDAWQQLVEDTEGRLTVMLTTPNQLVIATDLERVLSSPLLPAAAAAAATGGVDCGDGQQQQQQVGQQEEGQQQGGSSAAAAAAVASETDGRFIHIDT